MRERGLTRRELRAMQIRNRFSHMVTGGEEIVIDSSKI